MAGRQDIEAGKAYVTLYVKNSALVKGLRDAETRLKTMGVSVVDVGKKFLAGGSAIAAPLAAAAALFASTGDKLDKMSQRVNTSTNALSELGFAAQQSGQDIGQVESAISSMNSVLAAAGRFDSGAIQSLGRLGATLDDLRGKTTDEQFEELADRISRVKDPAERAARAVAVFGGAGQQLLPLLNGGRNGIKALREEAKALGLSIGPDQAKAAADLVDAWNRVKQSIKGVVMSIGGALAPAVTEGLGIVRDIVVNISKWVRANSSVAVTIAKVAGGLLAAGTAVVVFGAAIWGVGAAFGSLAAAATTAAGVVGALWGVVTAPAVLAVAAIVGIAIAVAKWTPAFNGAKQAGQETLSGLSILANQVMDSFADLAADIKTTWGGIVDAISAGDLGLAAEVAWAGVKAVFAQGVAALSGVWQSAKFAFMSAWEDATTWLATKMTNAWASIQTGWANAVASMKSVWVSFSTTIANGLQRAQKSVGGLLIDAAEKSGAISSEFAKTWREELDKPIDESIKKRTETADDDKKKIEAQRQKDVAGIEQNRQGGVDQLAAMRAEADKRLAAQRDAAKETAQAEVDAARAALAASTGKATVASKTARDKRAAQAAGQQPPGPAIDFQAMKSVAGTFSAQAAVSLGGASPKNLEQIGREQLKAQRDQLAENREVKKLLRQFVPSLKVAP